MRDVRRVGIAEVEVARVAGPDELIDSHLLETTVIATDSGIIGMAFFPVLAGLVAIVLHGMDTIEHIRAIRVGEPREAPEIEVHRRCILRIEAVLVRQLDAIERHGNIGEATVDISERIHRVDVVPTAFDAVVKMDVHDALVLGGDRLEIERTGRLQRLGIDDEGIDPVGRFGPEAGEEIVLAAVMERMAGEGRDVKFALFEQSAAPHEVIRIGGVKREGHELLLVLQRVVVGPRLFDSDEVIGLFIRGEGALDEAGRDGGDGHRDFHIIRRPDRLGVAGRSQE